MLSGVWNKKWSTRKYKYQYLKTSSGWATKSLRRTWLSRWKLSRVRCGTSFSSSIFLPCSRGPANPPAPPSPFLLALLLLYLLLLGVGSFYPCFCCASSSWSSSFCWCRLNTFSPSITAKSHPQVTTWVTRSNMKLRPGRSGGAPVEVHRWSARDGLSQIGVTAASDDTPTPWDGSVGRLALLSIA